MNSRYTFRLTLGAAVLIGAVTIFTMQTPIAAQAQRGGAPGQIAIPQPCTDEQIAAAKANGGQPPADAQAAGRGGRGTPCHMPDPRENLKPGLYDAGVAA